MITLSLSLGQARALTNIMDVAVRANGIRVVQEVAGLFQLITEATVEAHKRGDLNEQGQETGPQPTQTAADPNAQTELPLEDKVD
jgi:hypothetical protein